MGGITPALAVRHMKQKIEFCKNPPEFKMGMAFPDADNPEYVDLSRDGMVLIFVPAKKMGIDSRRKLGVGVNLQIQIDGDIDECYDEVRSKEAKVVIRDEPFGIRGFTVEDIGGYGLAFNQVSRVVKSCMCCGMPMAKPAAFGGRNRNNLYCVHCSHSDGSLKSLGKVFEGMTNFMMVSEDMDQEAAGTVARGHMSEMLAWARGI